MERGHSRRFLREPSDCSANGPRNEAVEPAADVPWSAGPAPHGGKTQQPSGEQGQACWFRNYRRNVDISDELIRCDIIVNERARNQDFECVRAGTLSRREAQGIANHSAKAGRPDIHFILQYAVRQHVEHPALKVKRQWSRYRDVGREADWPARQGHRLRKAAALLGRIEDNLTDVERRGILRPGSGDVE